MPSVITNLKTDRGGSRLIVGMAVSPTAGRPGLEHADQVSGMPSINTTLDTPKCDDINGMSFVFDDQPMGLTSLAGSACGG